MIYYYYHYVCVFIECWFGSWMVLNWVGERAYICWFCTGFDFGLLILYWVWIWTVDFVLGLILDGWFCIGLVKENCHLCVHWCTAGESGGKRQSAHLWGHCCWTASPLWTCCHDSRLYLCCLPLWSLGIGGLCSLRWILSLQCKSGASFLSTEPFYGHAFYSRTSVLSLSDFVVLM